MTTLRSLLAISCLLLVGCGSTASAPSVKAPPAVDVTGKWSGTYATNVGPLPVELTLKQVDADVTGDAHIAGDSWTTSTYKGAIKGTVSGNTFSYTYPGGGGQVTVNAAQMQGRTDLGKTLLMQRQ
jgi:hypothetical protein